MRSDMSSVVKAENKFLVFNERYLDVMAKLTFRSFFTLLFWTFSQATLSIIEWLLFPGMSKTLKKRVLDIYLIVHHHVKSSCQSLQSNKGLHPRGHISIVSWWYQTKIVISNVVFSENFSPLLWLIFCSGGSPMWRYSVIGLVCWWRHICWWNSSGFKTLKIEQEKNICAGGSGHSGFQTGLYASY